MNRQKVKSSNMASIGHDPKKNLLEVEFNSGEVYQYHPVTEEQHKELMAAESQGKWFWANIRSNKEIKFKQM